MSHFVYMLQCADGTLYTGWTPNLARRLQAHRAGKGAKYTRGRGPLMLVYTEQLDDKSQALRREAELKALPRNRKLALCAPFRQAVQTLTAAGHQDALSLLESGARLLECDGKTVRIQGKDGAEQVFFL